MATVRYAFHVFVNCPFDDDYRPLFEAIVFAVHDCNHVARCALEIDDASEIRIEKICRIISECQLGIHDISRTETCPDSGLPRFNMPFELGLYLGAKRFGAAKQKSKKCLILDCEKFRYQKFISDIAGQDIHAHKRQIGDVIRIVRNWLRNATLDSELIPGGAVMADRYVLFRKELPLLCERMRLSENELTFSDFVFLVEEWLKLNAQVRN
ncbi:MAG TPA: hypothetical protein VKX17_15750 [Planctomycetota bacterium]|nr:hypothetical protein [Planctomycetota bacterium]